jgi:histidyl-tRNA synthetase
MDFSLPRGTHDVLPAEWLLRGRIIGTFKRAFDRAGFGRILTPTFEHTELFERGVGEGTDIVGKEMYTFEDRSGRSLTLRPEGTAPAARAYVNHGMHRDPQPVKLWYVESMFRYEKPQAGRMREHWQIGGEIFGAAGAHADAELIALLDSVYRTLGVAGVELHVNSIGSGDARQRHRDALVDFLRGVEAELDDDSKRRIDTNPLRVFDSKIERTRELLADAPRITAFLTNDDVAHFEDVCELLSAADVAYVHDDMLVRGIDYYSRTTFEFKCNALGAQDTIGGGGRYDGLVETVGGEPTPAVGFGCGLERLGLALEASGITAEPETLDAYVCILDERSRATAFALVHRLRAGGHAVDVDMIGRGRKGQLKQASKHGARAIVLAEDGDWRVQLPGAHDDVDLGPVALDSVGQAAERISELCSQSAAGVP